jgi:hypothetical protein
MKKLVHKFVECMPEALDEGVIYVSIPYALASHLCCCGCGEEVVLKLSPTDWQLIFDGETVSFYPSIGNWGLKCRSHYWIRNNRVELAPKWTDAQIRAGRELDARRKSGRHTQTVTAAVESPPPKGKRNLLSWLKSRRP